MSIVDTWHDYDVIPTLKCLQLIRKSLN
jgi:hypothetical protein